MVTGAPAVHGELLLVPVASLEEAAAKRPGYACCTLRGSIVALVADTGKRLWQSFTIGTEAAVTRNIERDVQLFGPSGALAWSSPTVEPVKRLVYATAGNSYSDPPSDGANACFAFRLDDGSRAWVRQ